MDGMQEEKEKKRKYFSGAFRTQICHRIKRWD
jgi:hypothetical protein